MKLSARSVPTVDEIPVPESLGTEMTDDKSTPFNQPEPDGLELKVQQSKKAKQIEKRELFLQSMSDILFLLISLNPPSEFSLSANQGSKSHQRRMKRKAREELTGGLSDLQSALANLEKDVQEQQEPLTTINAAEEAKPDFAATKSGTIGKSGQSTLSKAQRKRALLVQLKLALSLHLTFSSELERFRHPLILSNPEFSTNPFQTIRTHAQNTLLTHNVKGKA